MNDEVAEAWRKLLNKELRNLYSSPHKGDQIMEDDNGRGM
jgi:hypothetical protein